MATSVARRCLASLLAVVAGGAVGYVPFLALTVQADGHGRTAFALVLAAFCMVGWLLVGLPVALSGFRPVAGVPRAAVIMASGCAGVVLAALVFQGLSLLVGLLAFLPAASSMFFYLQIRGTELS